ncbi:helix-hairpin-helix domain-containing protein [Hymenobacter sp. 15J16-1T3B]|uniref:ComEA family DNA-binding protein n=1 Tax=Hymenobacter sp. 15J16-1T3B TaxID=2886941 RepID=UPI001D101C95|nr:helix-hairpin-helix domain-containing protein [Hymenobacter sp. 15J16-1T3B]MCC3159220.1 helix-hairpin-helix domain-containing protein [Hymenobacter sp. 15J16-1T3B]
MSVLNTLRRLVRRHFGFSRTETNGFALLLLLLLALLAAPALLRPVLPRYNPAADRRQLEQVAAELTAARPTEATPRRYPARRPTYARVARIPLAPFDPNAVDETGWQARGLPRFLAKRLVKYRTTIGGFRAKEQIRKAYGLDDTTYQRLAPYLLLPEQLPPSEKKAYASRYPERSTQPFAAEGSAASQAGKFPRKPRHLQPFDLNAADTTQLMQIRGIGRRLSARVVEYRERLGGFISLDQAAEIYSLRDAPDLVDSLRKYTFVTPNYQPQPLNLNEGEFDEICQHPYLGKRLARVVVAYRQQHGRFRQPADLRQIRVLDDATYQKLLPYLRF